MHHSVARVVAVVLMAVALCACSAKNAATITIDSIEYETDTATVYVERPEFSFMKNHELADELNDAYEDEVDSALVAFDTLSQDGAPLSGGNKYVFEIHQNVKYNENDFISIVSDIYQYTGGAHGTSVWRAKNIDTLTGTEVLLADLFEDNNYKTVLNTLIEQEVTEHPEDYNDLWEKPQIKDSNQRDFYISDNGLVVFYQPYDLSYYARGFVEFTIDYDDISGYLKEEYRRLVPQ